MFFQINVTPKEKKIGKRLDKEEAETKQQETFTLTLAPFQPQTRINLESKLYNPVKCSLRIKNPTNKNLMVSIVKVPPKERSMELSASELLVKAECDEDLHIVWTPQEIGNWRDTLQLLDSRRTKYEVALITASKGVKKSGGQRKSRVLGPSNTNASSNSNRVEVRKLSPPRMSESRKNANATSLSLLNVPSKRPRLTIRNDNKENSSKTDWSHRAPSTGSHDFSAIMNSTKFNLTPIKTDVFDEELIKSSHHAGITSPETMIEPHLRRETYTTANYRKPNVLISVEENDDDENFVDSLSPQPDEQNLGEKSIKQSSDFSLLINNVNLTIAKIPFESPAINLSPVTGNLTSRQSSPCYKFGGNSTFDISCTNNADNSRANGTYELSTSPTRSMNLEAIKPTRLSKSFETMSPVMPRISGEYAKSSLLSSSPICNEFSRRTSICNISQRNSDDASVKEVLEADLWARSDTDEKTNTSAGISSIKGQCMSLERIDEENSCYAVLNRMKSHQLSKVTNISTKPRHIDISPPRKYSTVSKNAPIRRVSPTKSTKIRKDKKASEPVASLKKKVQMNCSIQRGQVSIPGVRIANLSLAGLNRGAKSKSVRTEPKEVSVKLYDPNDFLTRLCNPDPFGATMTQDPFLTSTLYYDDEWMHNQEMEFKKWLNALLTPPEHLNADVDTIRVDVGKVWQSCRTREDIGLAESREAVSARYHTNTRLNTLRKAACAMFRGEEITTALSKTTVCIERGTLMIRHDRDLHRDIGLQKEILELFLSYNPLWLRIGLETVYGETIPLHSNNDLVGLTKFLITRFFTDPFIAKTHSHPTSSSIKLPTFALHMNKFILKKFLFLVYFLDYAKKNKLIGHDPCLFHKRAPHKESRAILLSFSREILSGVGDVTKVLRAHGYIVSHKQTYLDEYDYAVKDIAIDMRDGVRLCRLMELITGDRDLTCRCRVPAISRLQKVHNVDVALGALLRCGYTLTGDIDAKSIADGHREKTLSLLWQIIYKYQKPRYDKAAKTIQRWWRAMLWYVRVRHYLRKRRDNAASTIQRAWRCYRARITLNLLRVERDRFWAERIEAVRTIQQRWIERKNMLRERNNFLVTRHAILQIQLWYRRIRETAPFVEDFQKKRSVKLNAVRTIQSWWRGTLAMKRQRNTFLLMKSAVRTIEVHWITQRLAKNDRKTYEIIRRSAIVIQRRYRRHYETRKYVEDRKNLIRACKTIQQWWRYNRMRKSCIIVQRWWRGVIATKSQFNEFSRIRASTIIVQRLWRAKKARRDNYRMYQAVSKIESWYSAVLESRTIRDEFLKKRNSALKIQEWWRGSIITRQLRKDYLEQRRTVIALQTRWRANVVATKIRCEYLATKRAAVLIQATWRMIVQRRNYVCLVNEHRAATIIKKRWRESRIAKKVRNDFVQYRSAVVTVQNRYRTLRIGRATRSEYLIKRYAAIVIQKNWRMLITSRRYTEQRKSAIVLQRRWRSWKQGISIRNEYVTLREATIVLQRRYRAKKIGLQFRQSYFQLRIAVLKIQKKWRATRLMREEKKRFVEYRNASIVLQSRWKMIVAMRTYKSMRAAAITLQSKWRARIIARKFRKAYLTLRSAVLIVQQRYRANKVCKIACKEYANTRQKIIFIQRAWRKKLENRMREEAAINIQTWWRSILVMRDSRDNYNCLKNSTLVIQRRYRAWKIGSEIRQEYARIIFSIVRIQRVWRRYAQKKRNEEWLRDCKEAVLAIENWWMLVLEKKRIRLAELALLNKQIDAATKIQSLWRGHKVRMSQCTTMREVRKRSERAAQAAVPSATVAVQLRESISLFLSSKTIGQLMACLVTLDTLTRLTPKGCIDFCKLNLVDKVYGTLSISNRSIPWIEVCERCTSILITLAKFPDTKNYVYKVEYIETLARLMNIAVEKHVTLFRLLATLVWLLAENPEYAEAITSCPRTTWLLSSVHALVTKKKNSLPTGNLNKSRVSSQVAPLPNSKPDWGLAQKRPRIFTTVHHAISSLIKRLKIDTTT